VGRYQGVKQTTLADWKNNSQLDANSLNVNPYFYNVSRSDLHVCNKALFQTGTPVSGITTDFDGDIRDAVKPCIGADEFAPVEFFSLGNDYGLCPGDSTQVVAGSGNFGEVAFWKDLSTNMPVDTGQILTVKSPGSFEVTIINACGILVDSVTIIQPDAVALPGDTNLCPDASTSFDASITNGVTYKWSSGDTTANITVTKPAKYGVLVTDKWNCVTKDTVDVTYSERATVSPKSATICEGKTIPMGGHISTGPSITYKWAGFLLAGSETGDNILLDYDAVNDNDTIYMTLTHRGCVTTDTSVVKRIKNPTAVYTHDTNGLAFNVKTNTSTGNVHWWDFGDGDTSVFPLPRHLYAAAGTYTVTYKNSNICGEATSAKEITLILLGLNENEIGNNFVLFPNPNNGNFNIHMDNAHGAAVSIEVIDITGKIIHSENYGSIATELNKEVNLNNLNAGMYMLNLRANDKMETIRFIVE
ncbi:MAG: T9SS type A sorting domain-containing protein, partial [Flavobacteriales bacterium]|nr:T9SS type A sorting domain-containing protein [Flavobacteriales bacterium]